MSSFEYKNFDLARPAALPEAQMNAIGAEIDRVDRALVFNDRAQAIGALKDLVESIARCVLEINGEATSATVDVDRVLRKAHELLRRQPGPELARESRAALAASSAMKIARQLLATRNAVGTGHGRAAVPEITADELTLLFDGALMWSRWAVRRLDLFCMGRPLQLVEDLHHETWTRGQLTARLAATDLLDEHTASQVGQAVGRRASSGTFVVLEEGIEWPANSDDLDEWPADYRLAAGRATLFDATGESTLLLVRWKCAIQLMLPALDEGSWGELVQELIVALPLPAALVDHEDGRWSRGLLSLLDDLSAAGGSFASQAQRLSAHLTLI